MNIIKGTNFWRLLSIILGFIIFLGLYYFFIVYPKDTEQARIRFSEEVMASFFWMDLSDEGLCCTNLSVKGFSAI
ncbi:hypothetical protein [Acinetobacter pittii]|uniref:hypothetical protein n=1 Tax=Acinetobacter pittii TaxID=48296 RepID=UPI000A34C272|nr:hypothetical protein [Acinetobacter pittii]